MILILNWNSEKLIHMKGTIIIIIFFLSEMSYHFEKLKYLFEMYTFGYK